MGDSERRKFPRGAVAGTATVVATGHWVGLYACENLSASGALLLGPQRLHRGDVVRLKLHLEDRRPVEVEGRVLREINTPERALPSYAMRFSNVPADVEDALQDVVIETIERQLGHARVRALVVHETELTRRAFMRDLKALGIETAAAASAQEAADWLEDPEQAFAIVIVDGHMEPEQKKAVLESIAETRPSARRLLVSGLRHHSLPHLAVASGHAHAVVTQPWSLRSLAAALDRDVPHSESLEALPHP